eukprot:CAMPEP_0172494416 /NCGR_PEP_ID=MMETSP1066-20121228/47028_1 /TAXON_ID=671091 /ORGANISM="Coscinodiscus wailesii, Strain CCMP2513" /LENGTH=88 /DNA_ID=CAMNT_0013265369 /DNA_START=34 /DNA_END=296 /DNA_ORIENTATION=+
MKVYSQLLAFSAFHTANGFVAPQGFVSRGRTAAYSYLDNIGSDTNDATDDSPSGPISEPIMGGSPEEKWDALWGTLARVRVQGGALKT